MKKILITGALGQIGTELVLDMRKIYGDINVIASSIRMNGSEEVINSGPFEIIDVMDANRLKEAAQKHKFDTVIHLAAILSAVGESNPSLAWDINMAGLVNVLEMARENQSSVFVPSSIAVFGNDTPKDNTPQDTLQRPSTMYGVTKVAGELLCDYYFKKYNVDARGLRFPGLISYMALPGGGTTDYAVHIYHEAIKNKKYTCYLEQGTYMDMMYMPDAINGIVSLMEADPSRLKHRNAFNVTAMSFAPEHVFTEIKKHIPEFEMDYNIDPIRQDIASSWPNSLDDREAREQWDWKPKYDLSLMTKDMLEKLNERYRK